MSYLVFSVFCSVAVSVLLKLSPRLRLDVGQMVMWNYLMAAGLCFALLRPSLDSLRGGQGPWLTLSMLALLLPSVFLILAKAVAGNGIVRTDVAQRLSLLLSLLAAFVWFGERADVWKLTGLALGLIAIVGVVARPETMSGSRSDGSWRWLLLVWAGFAAIDVMLKQVAQSGTSSMSALQVIFVMAFLLMLCRQIWRHGLGYEPLRLCNFPAGLLLGLFNFGNIFFYVRAHQALPENPATVFASMNIGVVVLGTLVGVVVFGEKTSQYNRLAIVLAIAAIVLIQVGLSRPG
ncbi:MAG: EamA/RhaT family transporter [Xanthomonadaceae bacterium]|jgi:drug/metabolite transporter (DMT)-like permease|nr:EamA/RhaT family transporter [Xanthomonadaceae bacterium]